MSLLRKALILMTLAGLMAACGTRGDLDKII